MRARAARRPPRRGTGRGPCARGRAGPGPGRTCRRHRGRRGTGRARRGRGTKPARAGPCRRRPRAGRAPRAIRQPGPGPRGSPRRPAPARRARRDRSRHAPPRAGRAARRTAGPQRRRRGCLRGRHVIRGRPGRGAQARAPGTRQVASGPVVEIARRRGRDVVSCAAAMSTRGLPPRRRPQRGGGARCAWNWPGPGPPGLARPYRALRGYPTVGLTGPPIRYCHH